MDRLKIQDLNFLADSNVREDNFMYRKSNVSSARTYRPLERMDSGAKMQDQGKNENIVKNAKHEKNDVQNKREELKKFDLWWQKKTAIRNKDNVTPEEKAIIDQMIEAGWKRKHEDTGVVINEFVLRRESQVMRVKDSESNGENGEYLNYWNTNGGKKESLQDNSNNLDESTQKISKLNKLELMRNKHKLLKQNQQGNSPNFEKQQTDHHSSGKSTKISKKLSMSNLKPLEVLTMDHLNHKNREAELNTTDFDIHLKAPNSTLPKHPALFRDSHRFTNSGKNKHSQKDLNIRLLSSSKKDKQSDGNHIESAKGRDYFEGFYPDNFNKSGNYSRFKDKNDQSIGVDSWEQQIQIQQEQQQQRKGQEKQDYKPIQNKIKMEKPKFLNLSKNKGTKQKKKRKRKKSKLKSKTKMYTSSQQGEILGYIISGFNSSMEPTELFKALPSFNSENLSYDKQLTNEQVFHLKINDFEPKILFQKCNDQHVRSILPEVLSYIYPSKIEGVYPFKLQNALNLEDSELDIGEEMNKDSSGMEYLDVDYLNE